MSYRPLALIILVLSILFLPYWVYLPLLLAALVIFPLFWEGIFLGFLVDALYGQGVSIIPTTFSVTLIVLLILILLLPLRERIRLHA